LYFWPESSSVDSAISENVLLSFRTFCGSLSPCVSIEPPFESAKACHLQPEAE